MTALAIHLMQEALQFGAGYKHRELELEKDKLRLELEAMQARESAEAARLSFQRSLKFSPTLDGEPQCPRCWVATATTATLRPVPSDTSADIFRCACGYETAVEP